MKTGIIGYGKMGKDIFSLFLDKLPDTEITVVVKKDAEKNTASVLRTLDKNLKRNRITQEQYDKLKASFRFTEDISEISDCGIVIETITENLQAKQEVFRNAEAVTGNECLLLTNTSSLDISEIFKDISHRERCFGFHFFYPVKLTGFVELNILPENSEDALNKAKVLAETVGKKPVVLSGRYHLYLNQLLSCMTSHAGYMQERADVSIKEMSNALSPLYLIADPFVILDSVGLGLMCENLTSFRIERNKALLKYGNDRIRKWLDAGCPGTPLSFLDFTAEHEKDTGNDCGTPELDMAAFLLNETVNALEEWDGDTETLCEAISETLGLSEKLSYYYKKYGAETLFSALDTYAAETNCDSYKHKDKSVWDKYFG